MLSVGDDRADPKEGVSVANKFVGDGVKFVVGHFNSGVTIPSSLVYTENGIVAITPAATNPCVTDRKVKACGNDKEPTPVVMSAPRPRDHKWHRGRIIAHASRAKACVCHDKTIGQGWPRETSKA